MRGLLLRLASQRVLVGRGPLVLGRRAQDAQRSSGHCEIGERDRSARGLLLERADRTRVGDRRVIRMRITARKQADVGDSAWRARGRAPARMLPRP